MPAPKRKPKTAQKALPLEKDAPALAPAPQPLFDDGPKEPMPDRHQDFHRLSWAFHKTRLERLGDRFFDPWESKHLKACKAVMTKARGNRDEVRRRMNNLWAWHCQDPDFYRFTPQGLMGRWDDMHAAPMETTGGKQALRKQAEDVGDQRAREAIKSRHG